jgi:hypothetical protein
MHHDNKCPFPSCPQCCLEKVTLEPAPFFQSLSKEKLENKLQADKKLGIHQVNSLSRQLQEAAERGDRNIDVLAANLNAAAQRELVHLGFTVMSGTNGYVHISW